MGNINKRSIAGSMAAAAAALSRKRSEGGGISVKAGVAAWRGGGVA
jgi:hypothetical protein